MTIVKKTVSLDQESIDTLVRYSLTVLGSGNLSAAIRSIARLQYIKDRADGK